jgi:hypothetical protein
MGLFGAIGEPRLMKVQGAPSQWVIVNPKLPPVNGTRTSVRAEKTI